MRTLSRDGLKFSTHEIAPQASLLSFEKNAFFYGRSSLQIV
ncbi:hypothetical protein [Dysgonomonas sp. 521]|nr:hypothetical protein [Dysgonomonas sp. 521]